MISEENVEKSGNDNRVSDFDWVRLASILDILSPVGVFPRLKLIRLSGRGSGS